MALVEAKRNLNDLGHGLRLRQENLAWLIDSTDNYDPESYRTSYFRSGHFDRDAVHEEGGEQFLFEPDSFGLFRPDAAEGQIIGRLYFITQPGPLWGVSAANLGRIAHRVSTDETWSPDSDVYLGSLFAWCRSLAGPLEAPDVLRLYAETPDRAGQVLFTSAREFARQ